MASGTVPNLAQYIRNGFNVLITGLHGTGKTYSVVQVCEELGLKVKYYSASTLDPYTDLVGVPVPVINDDGTRTLVMVRPREIDEAEVIIFDEANRSEAKTRNAIMELVQFRSINGEILPNLKCVIAAINPPGVEQDYDVEELDPALVDRFHVVIEVKPSVSLPYFTKLFGRDVAKALTSWWESQNKTKRTAYLSPRRLEMIGHVWSASPTRSALEAAMPPGHVWEVSKLLESLREAMQTPEDKAKAAALVLAQQEKEQALLNEEEKRVQAAAKGRSRRVQTVSGWTNKEYQDQARVSEVAKALAEAPSDMAFHTKVAEAYMSGISPDKLLRSYGPVLAALSPAATGHMVSNWGDSKKSIARGELAARLNHGMRNDASNEKLLREQYTTFSAALVTAKTKDVLEGILGAKANPTQRPLARGRGGARRK